MANFKKLYMRPNLENHGTTPATGALSNCPDIWVSGEMPVANYQSELAKPDNYMKSSNKSLSYNKDNYIYVRGKNGNESNNVTNNVSLYWAPASAIQWPSKWSGNRLWTDRGPAGKGMISNLAPYSIGVADRPFVWLNTPAAPSNSHYCLMAQFNDDDNSNPFPSVSTYLDMGQLVADNLGWGWRNITVCDMNEKIETSYQTTLEVPIDIRESERKYLLYLQPDNGLVGCQISFMCSQADSNGKIIEMKKTRVEQGGQILGCECILKPGFHGMISAYLYNPDGKKIPVGADFPFISNYFATVSELQHGNAEHLHNRELTGRICEQLKLKGVNTASSAIIPLGSYSGVIK